MRLHKRIEKGFSRLEELEHDHGANPRALFRVVQILAGGAHLLAAKH